VKFAYGSGDRPLDGFTVKRAIGHGGFGEVYYAVSDAGKDVALKLVQRDGQIELRGVRQCMNLKNPHLVAIYDIKTNEAGEQFVVMEYVAGASLAGRLAEADAGLPHPEVNQWLEGTARAVAHLHEHGIVHRDLKPANIFLEGDTVKVGDYGLSKSISASQTGPQTGSVGTVHYMAPEIGSGTYGRAVDIYALGVILHQMLTGKLPFDGESTGEILMKHLTGQADTKALPAPYRSVVDRALAKDPADRFASATEMWSAVSGAASGSAGGDGTGRAKAPAPDPQQAGHPPEPPGNGRDRARGAAGAPHAVAGGVPVARVVGSGAVFSLPKLGAGLLLGTVFAAAFSVLACGLLGQGESSLALMLLTSVLGTWCVLLLAKLWVSWPVDPLYRRVAMLVVGLVVGRVAGAASLPYQGTLAFRWNVQSEFIEKLATDWHMVGPEGRPLMGACMTYFGLAFLMSGLWSMADPNRRMRLNVGWLVAAAIWPLLVSMIVPFPQPLGLACMVVCAAAVQLASPWQEPPLGHAARGPGNGGVHGRAVHGGRRRRR